jgi:hypothetical protein
MKPALACFAIGAILLLLSEPTPVRVIGALFLLAFVVLGVRAIATPEFLAGDPDPDRERGRGG